MYDLAPDYMERRGQFRDAHLTMAWAAHGKGELLLGGALTLYFFWSLGGWPWLVALAMLGGAVLVRAQAAPSSAPRRRAARIRPASSGRLVYAPSLLIAA